MDITGTIVVIEDTVQISEKFRKREFVVEYATNPQYSELIKFEIIQDRVSQLDAFAVGQEVQVYFDVCGRKWVDREGVTKYFNSLKAWKVAPSGEQPAPVTVQQPGAPVVAATVPLSKSVQNETGLAIADPTVDNIPF